MLPILFLLEWLAFAAATTTSRICLEEGCLELAHFLPCVASSSVVQYCLHGTEPFIPLDFINCLHDLHCGPVELGGFKNVILPCLEEFNTESGVAHGKELKRNERRILPQEDPNSFNSNNPDQISAFQTQDSAASQTDSSPSTTFDVTTSTGFSQPSALTIGHTFLNTRTTIYSKTSRPTITRSIVSSSSTTTSTSPSIGGPSSTAPKSPSTAHPSTATPTSKPSDFHLNGTALGVGLPFGILICFLVCLGLFCKIRQAWRDHVERKRDSTFYESVKPEPRRQSSLGEDPERQRAMYSTHNPFLDLSKMVGQGFQPTHYDRPGERYIPLGEIGTSWEDRQQPPQIQSRLTSVSVYPIDTEYDRFTSCDITAQGSPPPSFHSQQPKALSTSEHLQGTLLSGSAPTLSRSPPRYNRRLGRYQQAIERQGIPTPNDEAISKPERLSSHRQALSAHPPSPMPQLHIRTSSNQTYAVPRSLTPGSPPI